VRKMTPSTKRPQSIFEGGAVVIASVAYSSGPWHLAELEVASEFPGVISVCVRRDEVFFKDPSHA
jgi:hypothetical protein